MCLMMTPFFGVCGEESAAIRECSARLDAIQAEYLPDTRLGVFQYRVEGKRVTVETSSPEAREAVRRLAEGVPELSFDAVLWPEENPRVGGRSFGFAALSVVNLLREPEYGSEMTAQGLLGMPIRVMDVSPTHEYWIQIQLPSGYLGWTTAASIVRQTAEEFAAESRRDWVVFTPLFGLIYAEPSEDAPTISDLVAGGRLIRTGSERSGWTAVSMPDGRSGYVRSDALTPFASWLDSAPELSAASILSTARRFLGFPYLWGGNSAKGIDCSGFVWLVFFLNRTDLLRDASQQRRDGEEIEPFPLTNLQPGDLLFFGKRREDGSPITRHVGIYLGGGEFIHSATRVKIGSLDENAPNYDPSNASELNGVRRLIGAPKSATFHPLRENRLYRP